MGAVAGPSSFMGGYGGGGGHMQGMMGLGSLLAEAGAPAAASVVQTGAAGMHHGGGSTVLWRDTATSELPPHKRSRLLHHSCADDVLAAFSEINDVEVRRPSTTAIYC